MSKSLQLIFSSVGFMLSGLTLKPFISFECIFVYCISKWSSFMLLSVAVQFSQHHPLFFLHCIHLPPLSQTNQPCKCRFISGLPYAVPLPQVSIFLCHYTLVIIIALQHVLKSGIVIPSDSLLKIALAIQGLLWFHIQILITVVIL